MSEAAEYDLVCPYCGQRGWHACTYHKQAHAMSHPMTVRIPNVDAMSDEINRLSAELAARTEHWEGIEFGLREENRKLRCENERLRKERDDVRKPSVGTDLDRAATDRMELAGRLTMLPALDHRLGTQQPEGEPVAPMGARWRWMP